MWLFFNELELKKQVKKTGYKTPDGYLDKFNVSIPKGSKGSNLRKLNKKYSFYIFWNSRRIGFIIYVFVAKQRSTRNQP